MANLIGKDIGRYHIIEQVGEGGMATVYKAFDTRLECEVAIKFIRKENILPNQLERMIVRFEREAKRMAKFTHPNIVKVIDFGEYQGSPYLVMPYLVGGTLKDKLQARAGKPIPYQEAARILAAIAHALEYAHEQDTIHRDVKPANILLTEKGQPLLTDFGVAKILDLEEGNTLTGTGVGVGTPEYMAPEQWMNKIVPQTDIYALGVVFYEMVTGRKPYTADTPAAVLVKQSTEPLVRPRQLNSSISEEAERVIYKAMAKDPLERYADMGSMAQALEKLGQRAFMPELHPQTGAGNETTIDYGSTAQPLPRIQDEPYRTVSFAETPSPEAQSTWHGMRSEAQQTKPQPPKLIVEQEKKPSGIAGWVWGVFVIAAVVIGVLALLLANTIHPPATPSSAQEAPQQTVPKQEPPTEAPQQIAPKQESPTEAPPQEPSSGETRTSQKDGMVSVFVPAGEFLMGSTQVEADAAWKACGSGCDKKWFDSEVPQHKVDLDGYWMDKTEITNAMFAKYVEATGYKTDAEKQGSGWVCNKDGSCSDTKGADWQHPGGPASDINSKTDHPVVLVSWNDAKGYCEWAGGRLPSEAQWEKAARGEDGRTYPWGNGSPDSSLLNYNRNIGDTTEVGKYPSGASPYGALDMSGNVWEWVNDWYADNYYQNSPQKNPRGASDGQSRVLRGGSWDYDSRNVRAADRDRGNPGFRGIFGFRCVR